MRYCEVRGETLQEALEKARKLYGEDVIYIKHREENKKKLFGKNKKEVIVEISIKENQEEGIKGNKEEENQIIEFLPAQKVVNTDLQSVNKPVNKIEKDDKIKNIERELEEVKQLIVNVVGNKYGILGSEIDIEVDKDFNELKEIFLEHNIPQRVADEYINRLKGYIPVAERRISGRTIEIAKEIFIKWIRIGGELMFGNEKRKIVMFVGPTGAGKTTTLVKLSAIYHLKKGIRVSLINTDYFRVAAADQLKKNAKIMQVPFHLARDPFELRKVLEKDKVELTLIDTNGVSPKDDEKLLKLKNFITETPYKIEVILVVPANLFYRDIELVFEKFSILGYERVIVSKVDETTSAIGILSVIERFGKALSYITTGQEPPGNIFLVKEETIRQIVETAFSRNSIR